MKESVQNLFINHLLSINQESGYFLDNEDIKKKRHSFHILRDFLKSHDCAELAKQDDVVVKGFN